MKNRTKQQLKQTLTWLLLFSSSLLFAADSLVQLNNIEKTFKKVKQIKFEKPDSAIYLLKRIHKVAIDSIDITKNPIAIRSLMEMASIYGHQGNYKAAYDQLWKALILADAAQNDLIKSFVYKGIGRYYSFFNRKEKAISFLQLALQTRKHYIRERKLEKSHLVDNYHAFVATYREVNEPELAQQYLDTAFQYHATDISSTPLSFLKFEQAVLHNVTNQPREAIVIFKEILPWIKKNRVNYQVLVYHYLGDSYKLLADYTKSESSYQQALAISEQYKCHLDFTPLIYERLYEVNYEQGDYKQATEYLKKAKDLDAQFFDSRSKNNRPLLEIQDAFRQVKEEQQITQFEQDKKVSFLEKMLLIGCLAFSMLFSFLYFKYVRTQYKAEKQIIKKEQEFIRKEQALEIQKTNELVELKNKELAAFALKLIEKENFIDSLKDKLSKGKGDVKREELEKLVRSASNNSQENWEEFDARFVSVNKSFYQKLKNQFPKLTQGDLKLCALIKLNFSSKEMAKLTGISVDSMHTTRSRLRKKLALEKGSNLKEFIANI